MYPGNNMTAPTPSSKSAVDPAYIELGRQLLSRVDGESQETAALIIGGSIAMTVDAQLKAVLEELMPVEKYVQDIKHGVPIDIVVGVVRACARVGHPKYPKECL